VSTPLLELRNLHVEAEGAQILRGVDLVVREGEVHALMGPNGAGKSTLANVVMGHPGYHVTAGQILFQGDDVAAWTPDQRARAGIFLAFQYPEAISGVSVTQFLRQAIAARKDLQELSVLEVRLDLAMWMDRLGMDPAFADRHLNDGFSGGDGLAQELGHRDAADRFSGGERKRNEVLQMALLEPVVAMLDETDSGLDIDALRVVARGVRTVRTEHPLMAVVVVTHYVKLLEEIEPDQVHILVDGQIVHSGGAELAQRIELEGYDAWRPVSA
jgi:Fe-S cluster assembly ATP-binding protein